MGARNIKVASDEFVRFVLLSWLLVVIAMMWMVRSQSCDKIL